MHTTSLACHTAIVYTRDYREGPETGRRLSYDRRKRDTRALHRAWSLEKCRLKLHHFVEVDQSELAKKRSEEDIMSHK
jgi:hypothetical protein